MPFNDDAERRIWEAAYAASFAHRLHESPGGPTYNLRERIRDTAREASLVADAAVEGLRTVRDYQGTGEPLP